ncbi:MAG: hypothetical protein J0I69_06770 [Altererythrobacter sp.]|nr:hypothetical protein [Altererythrobacter sp.]
MDFDQMLEAWKAQDDKPLYGVNADLLRLVLRSERDKIRRTLRRDQWITYVVGPAMAAFAAFWLWVTILNRGPALQQVAAAIGAGTFVLWVAVFWVSHRRLALRERGFGNSLKDEVRRNLSLVEYQISNGRWAAAVLWSAPVMIGALLIYWLAFQINTDTSFSWWHHAWIVFAIVWSVAWTAYAGDRQVRRTLQPRRERLRALLDTLNMAA